MQKVDSRRAQRFLAIAKEEATCGGFEKYAPVTKGPWVNGLIIFLLLPIVLFYVAYRLLLRIIGKISRSS